MLNIIWSAIRVENPEFDPQLAMSGATPAYTPEWSYFVDIGVMLVAVLCGLCGASIVAITWEVVPPLGVSPKEQ